MLNSISFQLLMIMYFQLAFVNADDSRNSNATFSDFIDIVAPGVNVYTSKNDGTYATDGGFILCCPYGGWCGRLWFALFFPDWNALQVMEQLRVSADDINDIANNSDYQYKFGKGRLNIF